MILSAICAPLLRGQDDPPVSSVTKHLAGHHAAAPITAFVDVSVIPMDRDRVLPHQTVLVQGDRITAIGPIRKLHIPRQAVRIDGRGKYLLPGFADMHTHIGMGDSAQAERALVLWLANGVTTIRNVDYLPLGLKVGGLFDIQLPGDFLLRLRARAASGTLLSPRIYTASAWGPPQYLGGLATMMISGGDPRLDSIASYVAAYKAAGYDFVKLHDESAVIAESVAVAARRLGLPVVGHVPVDLGLERALQVGYTSVEHLSQYLPALMRGPGSLASKAAVLEEDSVGGAPISDSAFLAAMQQALDPSRIPALVAATKRAGVWNCPTLEVQAMVASEVRSDALAQWPEVHDVPAARLHGWNALRRQQAHCGTEVRIVSGAGGTLAALQHLIRALYEGGAGIVSGTDASSILLIPYLVPGFALHREFAVLVQAGLTPYQALATSTRNVAEYFGTQAVSGTVTVGKRADLVLLGGSPLQDIRQTRRIAGVMRAGQWWSQAALAPRVAAALNALATARP